MSLPVGYWHLANQLTGWPSGRGALLGHESDPLEKAALFNGCQYRADSVKAG